MRSVAVGGTFDVLHDGHKALLRKAYELGRVTIGLVSDKMAKHKGHAVNSYAVRKRALTSYVLALTGADPEITELNDPYGPTLETQFDYIVVSPDTIDTAREINAIRTRHGMLPITIICVDFVRARDGKPISSSRIRRGEIDEHGVLL
ncbi:MAG: phosphopantetheine adenylyltransferase [Euryarchaeota archaeon]|nr:phosphopantetheine adenylyltransferase [Euryarchaeota archaeon]